MDSINRDLQAPECRFIHLRARGSTPDQANDVSIDRLATAEVTRLGKRFERAVSEVPPMTAGERR